MFLILVLGNAEVKSIGSCNCGWPASLISPSQTHPYTRDQCVSSISSSLGWLLGNCRLRWSQNHNPILLISSDLRVELHSDLDAPRRAVRILHFVFSRLGGCRKKQRSWVCYCSHVQVLRWEHLIAISSNIVELVVLMWLVIRLKPTRLGWAMKGLLNLWFWLVLV